MYMCMLPTLHMYNTCDIFVGGKSGWPEPWEDRLTQISQALGLIWGTLRKPQKGNQVETMDSKVVGGRASPVCPFKALHSLWSLLMNFFFKSGIVYTDQYGPLCLAQPLELINTTQLPYLRLSVCLLLHGAIHLTRSNKIHQNVAVSYTHERSRGRGNRSDHRKL